MPERRSGHSSRLHREVELPDHPELIEAKIAAQAAEIMKLVADNKRLASSHAVLREELSAARHETIRLKAHTRTVQSETDVQLRVLAEKSARAEAIVRAGESARNELAKAIRDAQSIVADRHELTAKIQEVNKKLKGARDDIKSLPGLRSELDSLRKEHQRHRSTFEYEKGSNMEQVEELEEMEQKLILMAEEVEKVRRAIARQHSMAYLKPEFPTMQGKIVTRHLAPAENVWASLGERMAQSNEDEAAVGPTSAEASASASASGAGKCEESDTPE